jgi:hypothetical protein
MNKIRYLIPLLAILLLVMPARAQLNTDDTPTVTELVEDILLGEGVQVYNITSTGANRAIGSFTTLPATFSEVPMDGGVICQQVILPMQKGLMIPVVLPLTTGNPGIRIFQLFLVAQPQMMLL